MIHQYKMNGYNIVLDVESGAIHEVDDLAFDIIQLYETIAQKDIKEQMLLKYESDPMITESEIEEVFSDIEELKDQGKLYSKDIFKDNVFSVSGKTPVLKALCLHIAHDCNMACQYCFAGKGEYQGKRALMSFETGKRALDFLINHSGDRRNLEVDFFGGEPLLNFEVVKKLVEYGRSRETMTGKKFRFTLTTNGVLLDNEITEYANREMSNVVLSLDGRKEVHDRLRIFKSGAGSYEMILPKFLKMAESRNQKDYYIRGTYTHFNTDFANDILHIADLGFEQISIEPVVASPDEPHALTMDDVPLLCEEYERLAIEMLRRSKEGEGFTFFHYMIDLEGGPCIIKRIRGCGVGTEYMAVTPEGDFYPCHQFVGETEFLLGNVMDGVTNSEKLNEFKGCNIYAREKCRDCFAKLYCSGGCSANAYHSTGDIKGVYDIGCILHKKRIECAIMLKVAEAHAK